MLNSKCQNLNNLNQPCSKSLVHDSPIGFQQIAILCKDNLSILFVKIINEHQKYTALCWTGYQNGKQTVPDFKG